MSSLKDETTQEKSLNKDLIAPSAFLEDKIQTVEANDISTADSDITENLGNDESKSVVDTSLEVTNESVVSSLDKELNEKGKLKIKRYKSKIFTIFHIYYLPTITLFLLHKRYCFKGDVKEETTASHATNIESEKLGDCSTANEIEKDCEILEDKENVESSITNSPGVEVLSPTSKRFLDKVIFSS